MDNYNYGSFRIPIKQQIKIQRASRGFTLLEIILALGLTAMIVLGSAQFLQQGARIWKQGDNVISSAESEMVALGFIRKILDKSVSVNWQPNDDGEVFKVFSGKSDEFFIAAPLPVHNGTNMGIFLFSFSVGSSKEQKEKVLFASYRPVIWESLDETLSNRDVEEVKEVIMTNVNTISIEYFGDMDFEDDDNEPVWQDEWLESKRLPLAIKISLGRKQSDAEDSFDKMIWNDIVMKLNHRHLR